MGCIIRVVGWVFYCFLRSVVSVIIKFLEFNEKLSSSVGSIVVLSNISVLPDSDKGMLSSFVVISL